MNQDIIAYLINRLLAAAKENSDQAKADNSNEFLQGKNLAYYEMLDMLKSGIEMYDLDISDYDLEGNLESLL